MLALSVTIPLSAQQENLAPEHAARMAQSQKLFKSTVRHALTAHCLKCHGGEKVEGEFNLTSRKSFLLGASGESVEIGKAEDSYLADMLYHRTEPAMPQNSGKLSDTLIVSILEWVNLAQPTIDHLSMLTNQRMPGLAVELIRHKRTIGHFSHSDG